MATEFVTLFDSNYLLKGLVLHETLRRHRPDARLTVYCFDEEARRILDELALQGLETVSLSELEARDPDLATVRADRSAGEYCWTATPSLPLDFLSRRPGAESVTYVDADLAFFADPQPLLDEMGDASVLITPHGFAPPYRYKEALGLFNVQFLTFRADDRARAVLTWWRERCLEWCYATPSEGRFGDQKYLDEWPQRFEGVHVARHPGAGVAPWNLLGREVARGQGGELSIDGSTLLFLHFHGLSFRRDGRHELHPTGYAVSSQQKRLLYEPYVGELQSALERVRQVRPGFDAGIQEPDPPLVRARKLVERTAEHIDRRLPNLAARRHARRLGI